MTWWKDIDITMEKKHNGDIRDFIDESAIMESLKNIFKTMQGERRRLPEFAVNLYELLFDPVDEITARDIGEIILGAIRTWEPRIVVEDLLVKPIHDYNRFDISLTFRIRNVSTPESFTYNDTIQAA